MTEAQLLNLLQRQVAKSGSLRQWANDNGISAPHVSRVLAGIKPPGDLIPYVLGLERVVTYRKIKQIEVPF